MSRRWVIVVSCVFLAVGALGLVLAQTSVDEAMEGDLRGIRSALVRIADALERQENNQKVELLIKRIEVHEKRLEPVRRRLAAAEEASREAESDYKRIERMRSDMERTLRAQADPGQEGGPGEGMRPMLQELDRQVDESQGQFETEQQHLRALQAELSEGRQAISVLDEELEALLSE